MTKLQTWMDLSGTDDAGVAEKVGLSRVQVSRIRRDVSTPSVETAEKLETLTGIPWHEFIKPSDVVTETAA